MSKVALAHAPDGVALADSIRALLRAEPVSIETITGRPPDPWEVVVILFVLTPGALRDAGLLDYARQAVALDLPLVPIVEDLTTYRFDQIPDALALFRSRNATGLQPGDGASVLESVRGYLGVESFAQNKKVFISYRRADTEKTARQIYSYLWKHKFQAFLDTLQLEAGAPVQERIVKAIFRHGLCPVARLS